jgi:hypothetical protein
LSPSPLLSLRTVSNHAQNCLQPCYSSPARTCLSYNGLFWLSSWGHSTSLWLLNLPNTPLS